MRRRFVGASVSLAVSSLALAGVALWILAATGRMARAEPSIRSDPRRSAAADPGSVTFTIALSQVASGLSDPVYLTHAGDGSGRLFIVEQTGRIRVIRNGVLLAAPYLDITGPVLCCGERGLLSVAFDPDFESNGAFYVSYTRDPDGDSVIARYVVSNPAADVANVTSAMPVLVIDQPQSNHNGGQLQFGPNDDYLYIGLGDGGGSGDDDAGHDPQVGNGQAPGTLLGKMLRIHVRGVPTYTIPASNPFTQTVGYKPEIWARGLRNPWRFSFDRVTGDMYIGDVGQGCFEEISFQPAGSHGGENYGWRLMEGFHAFDPGNQNDCSRPKVSPVGVTLPITDYGRSLGSTVTGGYVYRGQDYPWLQGVYFFADFGSGRMWAMRQIAPGVWTGEEKLNTAINVSSFGEDERGELYVVDYSGRIDKLTSTAAPNLSPTRKSASSLAPGTGKSVTYTVVIRNLGGSFPNGVRLTDTVPTGLAYRNGSLAASSGSPDDSAAPMLKWNGVLSSTSVVTITYAVDVTTAAVQVIQNTATINPGYAAPFTRTASIIANGVKVYLPAMLRR